VTGQLLIFLHRNARIAFVVLAVAFISALSAAIFL